MICCRINLEHCVINTCPASAMATKFSLYYSAPLEFYLLSASLTFVSSFFNYPIICTFYVFPLVPVSFTTLMLS